MSRMATATRSEQFDTGLSPDEAARRFQEYHSSKGGKVTAMPDGSLQGTTGKKVATRILGAFFVPRSWWPLKTKVRLTPDGSRTSVEIVVADNFGIGIRTGMRGKYAELMQDQATQLKTAMS